MIAIPQPLDFKLHDQTPEGQPTVVGRWFLRPVLDTEEAREAERWRLSFRHPELPRRPRQEGEGYINAVNAVCETVDELASQFFGGWQDQLLAYDRLGALPPNKMIAVPGIRSRPVKAVRTRIRREWSVARKAFEDLHTRLFVTLREASWPITQIPPWLWDPDTRVPWPAEDG